MNAIIVYDSFDEDFFSNTGYFEIFGNLKKNYKRSDILKNWITGFDRYFKHEVDQSPVIVHYNNINKLPSVDWVKVKR